MALAALTIPQPAAADTVTDWWEIASQFNFAQQVAACRRRPRLSGRRRAPRSRCSRRSTPSTAATKAICNSPRRPLPPRRTPPPRPRPTRCCCSIIRRTRAASTTATRWRMAQIADGAAKRGRAWRSASRRRARRWRPGRSTPRSSSRRTARAPRPGEWIGASPPSTRAVLVRFQAMGDQERRRN